MIKKAFFLVIICLQIHAQEIVNLRFGDISKMTFKDVHEKVIGKDEHGIHLLMARYNALAEVQLYTDYISLENLGKKYSTYIFHKETYKKYIEKGKFHIENVMNVGETVYLFLSHFNVDKLENELFAIAFNNGNMIGDPTVVLRLKCANRIEKGSFIFKQNKTDTYLTIIGAEPINKEKQHNIVIKTISIKNQHDWGQRLTLPYKDNLFEIEQIQTDDSGSVFILFKIYLSKEEQLKRNLPNSTYYFSLLQLSNSQEEEYIESIIRIEDKFIHNMCLNTSEKGNAILFTGLYHIKKNDLTPSGIYFGEMEKGKSESTYIKTQPLDDDFIPAFDLDHLIQENEDHDPEIIFKDIIKTANGYIALGEYQFIFEQCVSDFRSAATTCTYNYYFNEIFVFEFTNDGSLIRKIKIPKKQYTRNDHGVYSSFAYGLLNNHLLLVYNDNAKNEKLKNVNQVSFMTDVSKSMLTAVVIDKEGNIKKDYLYQHEKRKTWTKPSYFTIHDNEIIFLAEKARFYQLIGITPVYE